MPLSLTGTAQKITVLQRWQLHHKVFWVHQKTHIHSKHNKNRDNYITCKCLCYVYVILFVL